LTGPNSKTPKEAMKRLNGMHPLSVNDRIGQGNEERRINLSMDGGNPMSPQNIAGVNIYNPAVAKAQGVNLKKQS
jgi:hypothetical protein